MRSLLPTVRNPVLGLDSARLLAALPDGSRAALASVLRAISRDGRDRAEKCWRRHKAPMATYWKAVAVYARHLVLATEGPRA